MPLEFVDSPELMLKISHQAISLMICLSLITLIFKTVQAQTVGGPLRKMFPPVLKNIVHSINDTGNLLTFPSSTIEDLCVFLFQVECGTKEIHIRHMLFLVPILFLRVEL